MLGGSVYIEVACMGQRSRSEQIQWAQNFLGFIRHACTYCKRTTQNSVCFAGNTDGSPLLELKYSASPFGFAVVRSGSTKEVPLFNTAGTRIVFKV